MRGSLRRKSPPAAVQLRAARAFAFAALALAALCASCGRDGAQAKSGDRGTARLYAASSLTDALEPLVESFEARTGYRVTLALGASSTLAQQIREGAAAGVFVSASTEWVEKLDGWALVEPGSRVDFVSNALVVVVPSGATDRPARIEDLAAARFLPLALADPVAVPAGKYARAALESAGVFERLRRHVVAAHDVRTALAYVERGEARAGIVYATDAASSRGVEVAFRIPPELHPAIVYPMVLVRGAGPAARELHEFLRTPEAAATLRRFGFAEPPPR